MKRCIFWGVFILNLGCAPNAWDALTPPSNDASNLVSFCPNAKYLGTLMATNQRSAIYSNRMLSQKALLTEARQQLGPSCNCDVNKINVYNIRWDVENGQRKSAIFDVFLCGN